MTATTPRYLAPDWATRHLFNPFVRALTRAGISVRGARVLRVRGRSSGQWRSTPVNPLTVDGRRYLVAPRGTTQWVRNLRAVGTGELRVGWRTEAFRARELDDETKVPVLREYLRVWAFEVAKFFEGVDASSSDERLREVAPGFPAFEITPA